MIFTYLAQSGAAQCLHWWHWSAGLRRFELLWVSWPLVCAPALEPIDKLFSFPDDKLLLAIFASWFNFFSLDFDWSDFRKFEFRKFEFRLAINDVLSIRTKNELENNFGIWVPQSTDLCNLTCDRLEPSVTVLFMTFFYLKKDSITFKFRRILKIWH